MTQLNNPGPSRSRPAPENDIYTVLMLAAFVCILAATIYVGYRAMSLFGTLLPPPGA